MLAANLRVEKSLRILMMMISPPLSAFATKLADSLIPLFKSLATIPVNSPMGSDGGDTMVSRTTRLGPASAIGARTGSKTDSRTSKSARMATS